MVIYGRFPGAEEGKTFYCQCLFAGVRALIFCRDEKVERGIKKGVF
jgi:hypothetical protein